MNQILYTNDQKKKGGPLEIKTILIIFAVLCMLFGIILIGKAVYSMVTKKEGISQSVPLVEVSKENASLIINVKHDKIIDKIIYNWNDTQEFILLGKGRKEIQEIIELPVGNNILNLKVTDIDGKTVSYNQSYELEEGDVIKPEIELLVESAKVKIVAKDETELDYILYYWNSEDETRVDVREESLKQIEEKIDILKGENTLTIVAVDKAGNETTKEQIFKGVKKPKVDMAKSGNELIVKVSDEEGIQKIEITQNGKLYSTDPQQTGEPLNMKEAEIKLPLEQGENKITIKAYNISELTTEISGEVTI